MAVIRVQGMACEQGAPTRDETADLIPYVCPQTVSANDTHALANSDGATSGDVREYLSVLRRRAPLALTVVVASILVAAIYSWVKTPTYHATATVLVPQQQPTAALNISNSQLQDPNALQRQLSDEQEFAQGDAVKALATKALGFKASASVQTSTAADVLTFSATGTSKIDVARIANAYANAYIRARRQNQVAQYSEQVTALQGSISQLATKQASLSPGDPQRAALEASINTLTQTIEQTEAASQLVGQVGPTVIHAAAVPSSPTSPKPLRNILIGFAVGVFLGFVAALLWERLDDRIVSREVAESAGGGQPVVALLPYVDSWGRTGIGHLAMTEEPHSHAAEAFRTLRTAVQFLCLEKNRRIIAVTSTVAGEGKTTTVANLALSFARVGRRVVVLSADLRRPKLQEFFGVANTEGFTTVLLGHSSLEQVLQAAPDEPNLQILASGPVPPNPAEILSSRNAASLIAELAERADLLIIDCPPVLPVTDAMILSQHVDGVLVLASAKSTSRRALKRCYELLAQVNAPLLGTVLNQVPIGSSGSYEYQYGSLYYSDTLTDEIAVDTQQKMSSPQSGIR